MPRLSKPRILAIDPGTKHMGVAVLQRGDLIYHAVKNIRASLSPHERLKKGRALVLGMIKDFKPDVLAIEKAFFANNRNSALLNVFVDEIRALAKRRRITVAAFAPSTVKKTVTGNGRAGKREVARVVVSKYPELRVYLSQDRKWKDRYHSNMFDAVAVGLTALDKR